MLGGGELEPKSVRRLGGSRPRKGIKIVDLAARRLSRKEPKDKRLRNVGWAN